MPTGYGKSLCWILTPQTFDKICNFPEPARVTNRAQEMARVSKKKTVESTEAHIVRGINLSA